MYLLDTSALIVHMFNSQTYATLSKEATEIVQTAENLFVSDITLWELAIKAKIGKITLGKTIEQVKDECYHQGIRILPLRTEYIDETLRLTMYDDHKDAFDRLIIAIASVEGMSLITTDEKIRTHEYGVKVIW